MAKGEKQVKATETPERPLKRIAIVGCSDTKALAPYDDTSWDIWSMNNSFVHVKRQNAWFEIHPIKFQDGQYYRRELIKPGVFRWSKDFRGQPMQDYMKALADLDVPVYMQQHWDIIPKSEPYPLQEILRRFGNYFTNSVSYMIALAILQIFEAKAKGEIGCWGVDMSTVSEYGHQRPSCEFFLGIAAGAGISITIPPEADLLKTRFLYGFGEREQLAWEAKMISMKTNLQKRQQKALMTLQNQQRAVDQYTGAMEAVNEIQKVWSNLQDTQIWKGAE